MKTFLIILIIILSIIVFVGGLFVAFQAGKELGICKYGYIGEDEDDISENY